MPPETRPHQPAIHAPAGSTDAFLAALAAGADGVYCGLKHFSARMEADNFSLSDLAGLTSLAHDRGAQVSVAMNGLVKPGEIDAVTRLVDRLERQVRPDWIIAQDLAVIEAARQAGFSGGLRLSTLANVAFPSALSLAQRFLGISGAVLPRELTIDEIAAMNRTCPPDMDLEVFVHGALCYAVSGRCYWSSWLGGKSGLRGRCLQPCRRTYAQGRDAKPFFSCRDLGLDMLVKTLLPLERVVSWKIEGRKKGPHYVYYTVRAYKTLRDHGADPAARKAAQDYLDQALSRPTTHYRFLPQRIHAPFDGAGRTASGLYLGKSQVKSGKALLKSRVPLLPGDLIRLGEEDKPGHRTLPVRRGLPAGAALYLPKGTAPGLSAHLVDRREPELGAKIREMADLLAEKPRKHVAPSAISLELPAPAPTPRSPLFLRVHRRPVSGKQREELGLWLSAATLDLGSRVAAGTWWWLPPVVWPDDEQKWKRMLDVVLRQGGRTFVLNMPWQLALFEGLGPVRGPELVFWAGPFCNTANPAALSVLSRMGFAGAVVSPELGAQDLLALPGRSPLPLGVVTGGNWPLCVSRSISPDLQTASEFTSPKGEAAWARNVGGDTWLFPNWRLDLTTHLQDLRQAGYALFVTLEEPLPRAVRLKNRPGEWNWKHGLT